MVDADKLRAGGHTSGFAVADANRLEVITSSLSGASG